MLNKLIKHYAQQLYGVVGVQSHVFLSSALAGGEWSTSRSWCVTPRERAPSTHWIGGWVDSRTGLDDMEKLKFLILPGLKHWSLGWPAHSQSLYRLYQLYYCNSSKVYVHSNLILEATKWKTNTLINLLHSVSSQLKPKLPMSDMHLPYEFKHYLKIKIINITDLGIRDSWLHKW
jgi:hypothetical protein